MERDLDKQVVASVIVPVYNVETYLRRCLDSLMTQEYRNFEVLLIDDGSEDGSETICREYAGNDKRVRYFKRVHTGVSAARNYGIEQARGKYLLFVDSDDYVEPCYVRTLVSKIEQEKAALVISDYYQFSDIESDIEHARLDESASYSPKDYLKKMSIAPGAHYYGVVWNKIFRSDIAKGLQFDKTVSLGEDFIYNIDYFCRLSREQTICVITDRLYYYQERKGSLSHSYMPPDEAENQGRQILYQVYRRAFQSIGMEELWRGRMEFYIVKAYFEAERKWIACGADRKHLKSLYEQYIGEAGIGRIRFRMFCFMRTGKHIRDRIRNNTGSDRWRTSA